MLAAGCWLLAAGCWLLTACFPAAAAAAAAAAADGARHIDGTDSDNGRPMNGQWMMKAMGSRHSGGFSGALRPDQIDAPGTSSIPSSPSYILSAAAACQPPSSTDSSVGLTDRSSRSLSIVESDGDQYAPPPPPLPRLDPPPPRSLGQSTIFSGAQGANLSRPKCFFLRAAVEWTACNEGWGSERLEAHADMAAGLWCGCVCCRFVHGQGTRGCGEP